MALPFLPGYSFSKTVGQTNFPKPHHFDVNDDVTRLADKSRPVNSKIPRGSGPDLPAWVAFDKQVLGFDAYYTEEVNGQRASQEPYRVHRCKVMFYLEDDTMQVVELQEDNSQVCNQPPVNGGPCKAFIPAYYYDPAKKRCESFFLPRLRWQRQQI